MSLVCTPWARTFSTEWFTARRTMLLCHAYYTVQIVNINNNLSQMIFSSNIFSIVTTHLQEYWLRVLFESTSSRDFTLKFSSSNKKCSSEADAMSRSKTSSNKDAEWSHPLSLVGSFRLLQHLLHITCGVSQVSVLRPLLFLVCINNIVNASKYCFVCWWYQFSHLREKPQNFRKNS